MGLISAAGYQYWQVAGANIVVMDVLYNVGDVAIHQRDGRHPHAIE